MYKNSSIISFIINKTFSLRKFSCFGYACKKQNAIELINGIFSEPIAILGGDVYELNDEILKPLSDNWSINQMNNEKWEDYCERSKRESLEYINKYPECIETVFAFVFSEDVNDALELVSNETPSNERIALILDDRWLMCPDCIDAWESISQDAMVICPKCDTAFHNPRYK